MTDFQRGTVIVTDQNHLGSFHNNEPVMHYSVMQKKPIFAFSSLNKQNTLYQWPAVMFKPIVSGYIGAFRPEKLIFLTTHGEMSIVNVSWSVGCEKA